MVRNAKNFVITDKAGRPDIRHQKTLEEALAKIHASDVSLFLEDVILYGSCARGDQHWESDVDLLLVVSPETFDARDCRQKINILRNELRSEYIFDPDVDAHVAQTGWENRTGMYYKEIRKDGRSVW